MKRRKIQMEKIKFCIQDVACPFPGSLILSGKPQRKQYTFSKKHESRLLKLEQEMMKLSKEVLNIFLDHGDQV